MTQNIFKANATTDANGRVDIAFPLIAVNTTFTGIVSIPLAPTTAHILVDFNGQVVASVDGYSQFGPFQLGPTDKLDLIGTGMEPDLQYQGVMIGNLTYGVRPQAPTPIPTAMVPTLGGTPTAGPVPTLVKSGTFTIGVPFIVNVPLTTRVLIIDIPGVGSNNITVTGDSTGDIYYNQPAYIKDVVYVPVNGVVDPAYTIEVT